MGIITGRNNVLKIYEDAAAKGWVIPCFCSENLTTTEAILTAAEKYAVAHGYDKIPVTIAITNQYDHRHQSVFYTHTRRWDIGLKLFYNDIKIACEAFEHVDVLIHLDHAQYDTDAELLDSDLTIYSSVMYDASACPIEENIRLTKAFVEKKGKDLLIEGACDEIVDATGAQRCEITDADKCEHYMKETGVDVVVANLGTEHRASGKTLHYYQDAAQAICAKVGPKICLHGTSSVSNDQIKNLFKDGICKVNIWTALERDSSPLLAEFMVKNVEKVAGEKMTKQLIDEGYLTDKCATGNAANLGYFTTAARQEVVFDKMVDICTGYFDMWYI